MSWQKNLAALAAGSAAVALYLLAPLGVGLPLGAILMAGVARFHLTAALMFVLAAAPLYRFPRLYEPAEVPFASLLARDQPLEFSIMEFVVLASALGWLAGLWGERRQASEGRGDRAPTGPSWLGARWNDTSRLMLSPVTLLLVAATVSLAVSEVRHVSLREYRVVVLEPLLFYAMLRTSARGWRAVEHWLTALVTLGLVLSAVALYHYFFIGVVEETGGVRRLLAIYHSPNALALFLGRILPVALVLLVGGALVTPWQRILYTASALCLAAVLWLTYSRGAWVAVVVALAAVALWHGHGKLVALGSAAAGLAVAALALAGGPGRILSGATERQRLWVWQSAMQMIRDHPWLGVGLDNFLYQYRARYRLPEAWAEPDISHPHNMVLDFWTRLGLPGVAALAWLQLRFWRSALASLRMAADRRQRALALAVMAAMLETLVHGLVDSSFFLIDLAILFWLFYALAQAPEREPA